MKADLEVPMSENRTFRYFKEETLLRYAEQFGWTIIHNKNRKDVFMEMVRKMDMSYSYKPVLLKAVLNYADSSDMVRLDDIVRYFKEFYQDRREAGLVVEKPASLYARGDCTDKEVLRNILANPFKRFEDMNMMRHAKTLELIQVDEYVWKYLTDEEKIQIEHICDEKLAAYYNRISNSN